MAKRTTRPESKPALELWPTLEADDAELVAHMDRLLRRSLPERESPPEPSWLVEAFEAAWPRLLEEAGSADG